MEGAAALISAFASLAWAVLPFWLVWQFRTQINDILPTIDSAELLGAKFTVAKGVRRLKELTSNQEPTPTLDPKSLPTLEAPNNFPITISPLNTLVRETDDRPAALRGMAREVRNQLKRIIIGSKSVGWEETYSVQDFSHQLIPWGLPKEIVEAIPLFLRVVDAVAKGQHASEDEMKSAMRAGHVIMSALHRIRFSERRVLRTNFPLYSDKDCLIEIPNVFGIEHQSLDLDGRLMHHHVSWSGNPINVAPPYAFGHSFLRGLGDTWYKDADTGASRKAFNSAAETILKNVEDVEFVFTDLPVFDAR